MILKIKEKLIYFSEKIHLKIFGHEMSDEMKGFLENLSWSFIGGMIAAIVMFVVNILAGRILGPMEYGSYNYLLSLASSLTFFFLLGNNTSSIRFISDENYKERKNNILSAIVFLTLVQSLVLFVVIFIFKDFLSGKFNLNVSTIYFIFFMGFIFSFKEIFDSFLRSFNFFKKQSFIKIGDAIFVFSSFISFFLFFGHTFKDIHYAWSMMIGASFSILISLFLFKKCFVKFEKKEISTIFRYNKFLIIGGFSGFIMGLEKVFIGKYIGTENLGNYSAYYASSQMIISNFGILFMNIFWPTVIKNKDNINAVVNKLSKVFFRYFPVWVILNFISISFFIFLYGKQYHMSMILILFFSIASLLNVFFSIFMTIMNIDKISRAILINMIIYSILILSIVVFKSIPAYLIVQIIIYSIGIVYVRKKLMHGAIIKA